jgi:hypothetical protein
MGKKKRQVPVPRPAADDQPATLKDLLSKDVLNQLKAQAEGWKAEEAKRAEQHRLEAAEAKKAEQKRLENNFEYLLENSDMNWRNHK